MRYVGWNGLWIVALVALAGCLSPDEAPAPEGPDAPVDGDAPRAAPDAKSSIEGVVLKEDFSFVKDARLHLSQDGRLIAESATDAQGRYAFTGLESEEYLLQVSAPCCKAAVFKLKPPPGDVYTHNIRLEELPSIVPYVVEDEWHGFIGCGFRLPVYGSNNPEDCDQVDSNTEVRIEFPLHPGLQTVVVAMVWEASGTNLMEDLRLMMYRDPNTATANRFFDVMGKSPIEKTLGPEDAEAGPHLYFENIEETWGGRFRVWVGGDANVVYQQPFSVYYQLHYLEPAPPGTSALP